MKHKLWYIFFILGFFLLTSCVPYEPISADNITYANVSKSIGDDPKIQTHGNLTIPQKCVIEGYQTFITLSGKFCFAYPPNTYIKEVKSTEENFIEIRLSYLEAQVETIVIPAEDSPTGTELIVPIPTSESENLLGGEKTSPLIYIRCETSLDDHVKDKEAGESYRLPFAIGNETAQIIGIDKNGRIDHVVKFQRGNRYCRLKFDASLHETYGYGFEGNKVVADELIWPILSSFSFVD